MATAPTDVPLNGLSKYLIKLEILTEVSARKYTLDAKRDELSLLSYLVINKLVDDRAIAEQASIEFGMPFFDLDAIDWHSLPINLLSDKMIRKYHVLPLFSRGKTLFIALSDPTNLQVMDDIKFQSRLQSEAILVEESKLSRAIEQALEKPTASMDEILADNMDSIDINADEELAEDISGTSDADDAPVVKYVNQVLLQAIKQGASDIHMEPYEKNFRIRFRQDGILRQVASPPASIANRLISRLKIMSKMDIAERRVPQDGRIKTIAGKRAIDFRVNTCPTLFGEKVVLRILDPTSAQLGIEKLGFEPAQQQLFLQAINRPYGLVLVTGPTGSGKTVTLYTGLNILNTIERNISTAEDPVEITVEGINQVNVNAKAGLTFASALRAFLRQDPDVIMVGEIRDLETAEIAVKAAQTGHLVLSTLHTNDAPQTLNRLLQMGIPPFNIVAAVNLIMAQRLGRRLCVHCKAPVTYPDSVLLDAGFKPEELKDLQIFKPVGCDLCSNGYKGRVGVYQVMTLTEKMRALILKGGNTMELAECSLSEGFNDLRLSGLNKVRMGLTSLEEIDRITKE
ncbi:MAG: type IV-A pilus assembly ATPase PilB [Methylococcaceae bacterium]